MTTLKPEELPIWMQRSMRRTDWGLLLVLAFSLMAAWAFIFQPGLPRTNESEHYVYQAANIARSLSEGRLYPRWSADALNGYGAPIPQFYPPGASYTAGLLSYFVTGNATVAVKLVFIGALVGAGAATYAFVTRRSGAPAGVTAALLYVYSPYVGLTAPHLLGDLPGVVGAALIPALLWSIDRLLGENSPFDFACVSLITAALVLTEPRIALAGWLLGLLLVLYTRPQRTGFYRAIGAGVSGAGIGACYWLPAFIEAGSVKWFARPLFTPHELRFPALLLPQMRADPDALLPTLQFTVGITLILFTLASAAIIVRRFIFQRLFLLAGLAFSLLGLLLFHTEVWLLSIISLCLSIGGSAFVFWKPSRLWLPILCGIILGSSANVWLTPAWSEPSLDTSPLAQIQYEQRGFGIATLPDGSPLPSNIPPNSPANSALLGGYRTNSVNKLEQNSNAQIGLLEHESHEDRFQARTFAPFTLRVLTAGFPGWAASLNGAALPIDQDEQGFIQVSLPGETAGELLITLDSTPTRTIAWIVTWAAVIMMLGVTIRRSRRSVSEPYQPPHLLETAQARLVAVLVMGFGAVLALVALPNAPLKAALPAETTTLQTVPVSGGTASALNLLNYELDRTTLNAGESFDLALYWQTSSIPSENYQVRVSLLNLNTGAYTLRTALRDPGGFPTLRWLPRRYVEDRYRITTPIEMPAGDYSPSIEVCSAECFPSSQLDFYGYDGNTYGSVLVLPVILSVEPS